MKKLIYTFIVLIAIVGISNKANAQASTGGVATYTDTYEGATHEYTLDGLDSGDDYAFYVQTTNVAANYADSVGLAGILATSGTDYSMIDSQSGTGTGTLSGTSITDTITWKVEGTYYLWIEITDQGASGCSNFRFLEISVTAYDLAFKALALISGDETTINTDITGATGGATASDCPAFLNENFDTEDGTTDTEGSTYAYFSVTRYIDGDGTLSDSDWKFTPSIDADGSTITSWDYSYDGETWASVTTISDEFTADYSVDESTNGGTAGNVVYFRATVTNVDETTYALGFDIGVNATSTTAYDVTGNIQDGTNTEDESTLTLSPLPQIGSFSAN